MGRLTKEALYSTGAAQDHQFRASRQAAAFGDLPEGCDTRDFTTIWERLAERIKKIDPLGEKSFRLLQEVLRKR